MHRAACAARLLAALTLAGALSPLPALAQGKARLPVLGLGYEYDLSGAREEFLLPDPLVDPSIVVDHPLYVRIRAPWSLLEHEAGVYDWSEVDRIVDPYRRANFVVILCLYGTSPAVSPDGALPSADRPEVLKGWLDLLRAAAQHFKGRVRYYEVWDEPNREAGWPASRVDQYAYVLKNSSVTIRSTDPGALVVEGGLAVGNASLGADLAWQEALYGQDISTYVDVLALHPAGDAPIDQVVARAYDLMLDHDPSAQLWVNRVPIVGESDRDRASDLLARFIAAQGEGASVVTFDLEADVEGRPEFPGVLLDLHKLFIPTYSVVHGARVTFEPFGEGDKGTLSGITAYKFFDAQAFQGLIGFYAAHPPEGGKARLVIDTAAVRGVAVYDIVGGVAGPIEGARNDFKTNTTRVPVFVYTRPQVLQYARVPIKGFETEKQQVEIKESGLITAEEVIAGHQAFMADQNFRLKTYRADALLSYHGKIGGSQTIDISIDNAFFWEKGRGAEWQQKTLYYNGVRWKGKTLPELPIPQPEKVFTLPLDINLDKNYRYTYVGRETVRGYDCYVLDFKPIVEGRSLYEGRAWIETRTFAPVQTSTVQTRLEAPIISNEEKDGYAPVTGPDGTTYWLLTRVDGQQILTVAGQNLVLLREIDFKDFQINDPGFEAARRQAYESNKPMLRDTDKGLRYLEKTGSGERVVREGTRKSALLGLVGLYHQTNLSYPVIPLAGVGYFNFNFRGRHSQLTALLGGVINLATYTDPNLFGHKIDATVQVVTFLVNVTDQLYIRGVRQDPSNVDTRTQHLSAGIGLPLGNFVRVKGTYDLAYVNYGRDKDTDTFVTPTDTLIQSPGIDWEFNRARWTVSASAQRSYRRRWKPWGDTTPLTDPDIMAAFPTSPCDSPGSCLAEFDADQKDYDTYEFSVSKQFFLPLFQKLRFETTWMTGSRLDRFSEFQFSFFGNRLRGLSGSGVRFDRGGVARAQYSFDIADVIRFDASLDYGRVKDSLTSDRFDRFTGFGVSGNLMGPWQTILQFDIGVAVQSDIKPVRGDTEFQLGLLKYF
ncbi:MAG TPA: hypothetical protein VNL37_04700 [Candidatus Polarisedimenticolia bacterium]|nr:hypothetical protein [Candidatus Polarisedimenticolia bacterium]